MSPPIADAAGTTYYIDNIEGDDGNNGTDPGSAWKSLDKVNATTFSPGDRILFKAGGSWNGRLWPKGSGASGSPIVIDQYGTGSKPLIAGVTSELEAIFLKNQQYWEINNLEVTNRSPLPFDRDWENPRGQRRGVYILNEEAGILRHIQVKNLTIHDVDGSYTTRSGGIIFDSVGSVTPSAFDGILIDGNTLTDVDAYGIYIGSNCILRHGMSDLWPWVQKPYGPWTPSTDVKISNNTVIRAATGGIAWNVTDGAIVEHNTVQQATYLATNASIWWAYADNNLVQFNESFESVNGAEDGHGFDVDAGNLGSIVQYNYSHDNAGGFMLFVNDTYYTINTIVRYNISQNDRKSIFRYSGSIDTVYNYNNSVYVGEASANPVMSDYFTKASGSPININNYNNAYYSVGDKGWDLRGQHFDYNAYFGGNTLVQDDAHKVIGDPKFASPGSGGNGMNTVGGYQLQPDSPLIGSGIRITDNGGRDYYGNPLYNGAPDIGAHEYAGSVPPAGQMPDPITVTPVYLPSTPTDNLAPLATASTTFTTKSAIRQINDKYYETIWSSETSPIFPNDITLDFGSTQVTANLLKLNASLGQSQGITNFDLEYHNGSAWVPIRKGIQVEWKSNTAADEIQSVKFPTTMFNKLRLKVNGGNLQQGHITLNELELYFEAADIASTTFPTGGGAIANIIDNNVSSTWGSSTDITLPGYITLDYGDSSVTVNKITLITHFGIGQGITNVDVEYFDGAKWVTALSNASIVWKLNDSTKERQSIELPTITASKIRLKVNDANREWGNIALNELILENHVVVEPEPNPTPGPTLPQTPVQPPITAPTEDPGRVEVQPEQLKGNGADAIVIRTDKAFTELVLPGHAPKLAGGSDLVIQAGDISMTLPYEWLQEVVKALPNDQTQREKSTISLSVERMEQSKAKSLLIAAGRQAEADLGLAGEMLAFNLTVTNADGRKTAISRFDQPLAVAMKANPQTDRRLAGVYYVSDSGALEYIGGEWKDGWMKAEISHFSNYAILEYRKSYLDVATGHWASEAITDLSARHVVEGVSASQFAPEREITRAEFTAMLVRALGLDGIAESQFEDVKPDAWYAKEVALAAKAGIISGKSEGRFEPTAAVTRQEMAAMIVRAYAYAAGTAFSDVSSEPYNDTASSPSWAREAIAAARGLGLMKGSPGNLFKPDDHGTRAQGAKLLHNLLMLIEKA
ncbi:S-layer homology domain-containing protein [Paenibacillus aurantiacus]|uniref:S-layer homology domain-containing protein n=1 Tax=Paenibacillus aurantiacus TaxID=1936118 RepID=A0ABV5KRW3_9BACL